MRKARIGVYIHVPFCIRKCLYCDFNSYPGKDSLKRAYVDALCREMSVAAEMASQQEGEQYEASTLYVGGGTPTLLSPDEMGQILIAAERYLGWNPGIETTVEANPGTIDHARASELRRAGVNRISLGVQSLDEMMLRQLGRVHSAEDAVRAYDACRRAGFENISIDLMYALPNQSLGHWENTLARVIGLAPKHLSLYPLAIEEETPFHQLWSEGSLSVPTDDEAAQMYEVATRILADAGYEQYEISNWALGGTAFQCRHNLTYWKNGAYLGLGAGAHSSLHGRRFSNVRQPETYISLLNRGDILIDQEEHICVDLEMKETAILSLRLVEGISRREFAERFSCSLDDAFGPVIPGLVRDGLLRITADRIALTSKGMLLANEAFIAFLASKGERAVGK